MNQADSVAVRKGAVVKAVELGEQTNCEDRAYLPEGGNRDGASAELDANLIGHFGTG